MIRLGITGGLGSGKSTVLGILADLGAHVVSADDLAKDMIKPGGAAHPPVAARFPDCLKKDGSLDHGRLASKVFGDARSLAWLNGLIHPLVARGLEELLSKWEKEGVKVAAVEVPLLAEAGFARQFDIVVAISAPLELRLTRLAEAGWKLADAKKRIASQVSDAERETIADVVIDNSSSMATLKRRVRGLWEKATQGAE